MKRSIGLAALSVLLLMFVYCGDSDEPTAPAEAALCLSDSSCALEAVCDTSAAINVSNCGNSTTLSWSAETDAAWLSLSVAGGETPAQFCLVADSNRTGSERTATVTVATDDLTDESVAIDVIQPSVEPTLSVSLAEWDAYCLGEQSEPISVTNCGDLSSFDWTVTEDEDWLELSVSFGSTPGNFIITADTNNTQEDRIATVTVTAEGVAGSPWEITVGQPPIAAIAGSFNTPGIAYRLQVSGGYAYVADGVNGLEIIDVTDPSNPDFAGNYVIAALAVHVSGNYAYVAAHTSGLAAVDVSEPSNPTLVDRYDTQDQMADVFVSGSYAYVAYGQSGLQIIEITDPSNLTFAGGYDTPASAFHVYVSGAYAYVVDYPGFLQVVDVTNPAQPDSVGSYVVADDINGVCVSDGYAYLAAYGSGLQILDVSDPSNPTPVGSCDTPDYALDVEVSGDYACVAGAASGLQIIDVSNPAGPVLVGSCDTPGHAYGVFVSGGYAYVADTESGLQILKLGL